MTFKSLLRVIETSMTGMSLLTPDSRRTVIVLTSTCTYFSMDYIYRADTEGKISRSTESYSLVDMGSNKKQIKMLKVWESRRYMLRSFPPAIGCVRNLNRYMC